jgi:hypothetical protein
MGLSEIKSLWTRCLDIVSKLLILFYVNFVLNYIVIFYVALLESCGPV